MDQVKHQTHDLVPDLFYIGERPVANISCVFRTKPQIKQHTMYGKRCLIATGKPLWRFVGATVHLHIFKPAKR